MLHIDIITCKLKNVRYFPADVYLLRFLPNPFLASCIGVPQENYDDAFAQLNCSSQDII